MKDTAYSTFHCQYSLTSLASLDMLEKYVLVYEAAELDEMNGRTWTVESVPKKTEASTVKALQFLACSHLARKLEAPCKRKSRLERSGLVIRGLSPHLAGCLPGAAWIQAITLPVRKHQALKIS